MKKINIPKEVYLIIVIIVIVLLLSIRNSAFYGFDNIMGILKNNSVVGICAIGMTYIIITGGIDVSVGAFVAAICSLTGYYMMWLGKNVYLNNIFVVISICIISGAILGGLNGLLIGQLKIPPIVATLATYSIVRGSIYIFTKGNWVTTDKLPSWLLNLGDWKIFNIPVQILIFLLLVLLNWVILKYTVFGRSVYAIGGNSVSATRVGINQKKTLIFVYIYMGILIGIAAFVHTSIIKQVDPNSFLNFELQVIGVVIVGGTVISGGRGSIFGTLIGVILLGVIRNGMVLAYIPSFWYDIVTGSILIFAVSFDIILRNRAKSNLKKINIRELEKN